MPKVVFDTNIYISAFLTRGGRAEEAFLQAVEGRIELFTSAPILREMATKLREKFLWDDEHIEAALRHIGRVASVVRPRKNLRILTDDPDNRILECAAHAGADLVVTGDRHLLDLKVHGSIKIITLAEFLGAIGR